MAQICSMARSVIKYRADDWIGRRRPTKDLQEVSSVRASRKQTNRADMALKGSRRGRISIRRLQLEFISRSHVLSSLSA
jgi:hypothetical protein